MADKFARFNVSTTTYRTVNDHDIEVDVLVPKDAKPGKHPVAVFWHGGGLITGTRNFADWIAEWLLDLIARNSAIMVTADYRLLPEATGADILDDLSALYLWVSSGLAPLLAKSSPGVEADLDHLLTVGPSAGGWCTLQAYLNLASPPKGSKWVQHTLNSRAAISIYPMVHFDTPYWSEPHGSSDGVAPLLEHLEKMKHGGAAVVTHPDSFERVPLFLAMLTSGRLKEFLGDAGLDPLKRLKEADSNDWRDLPPLWVIHGTDDTTVPIEGSEEFIKALTQISPEAKVIFTKRPGDHGFDGESKIGEEWLHEGLELIQSAWL